MATGSLEERVAELESKVSLLLQGKPVERPAKDWRRTVGMFTGDEIMWQICQNALEYREEDRRRSLAEFDAAEGDSA